MNILTSENDIQIRNALAELSELEGCKYDLVVLAVGHADVYVTTGEAPPITELFYSGEPKTVFQVIVNRLEAAKRAGANLAVATPLPDPPQTLKTLKRVEGAFTESDTQLWGRIVNELAYLKKHHQLGFDASITQADQTCTVYFVPPDKDRVHLITGTLAEVSEYVDALVLSADEKDAVHDRAKAQLDAADRVESRIADTPEVEESDRVKFDANNQQHILLDDRVREYNQVVGKPIRFDAYPGSTYRITIEHTKDVFGRRVTFNEAYRWIKDAVHHHLNVVLRPKPQDTPVQPSAAPTPFTLPDSVATTDVIHERKRQIAVEQYNAAHDERYVNEELRNAAVCYISSARWHRTRRGRAELKTPAVSWPWPEKFWKPKSERQDLVRAAALLIAEIDRLDREKRINSTQAQLEAAEDPRSC